VANPESKKLTVEVLARVDKLEKGMARASAAANDNFGKIERRAGQATKRLESRFEAIGRSAATSLGAFGKGAAAGLVASLGVREIGQAAAAYTDLTNRLKVVGLEGDALTGTFRNLFEIAQRNGTAIEPLVTLYSRLAQSQTELGVSGQELTRFTEGIAVALRAGSTDAQEASGALLQLGQALGGSVVRAEEFNSMLEGTPTILQTVATGLEEAGGSVSKLRNLVLAGKVSSEAFFRAFLAGMPQLEQKAAKATGTVSQGMTRVSNALIAVVGELDKTTGASENAATNLSKVGAVIEGLPGLIDRAVTSLKGLGSYLTEIGNSPIWRKIGEAIGVDYSPEGLAKYGITTPQPGTKRAGSSRRGGAAMARTGIGTVSINDAPVVDDGKATRERVNDYERLTAAIRDRTGAIVAETQAQASLNPLVNDYGFALEKARAQYDLTQAATEAGLAITPKLEAQIDALATSYADASVAAAQLAEAQGKVQESAAEFNDLGRDVLGGFISDMQRGVSAAAALENALGKVADKLLDVALNTIFPSNGAGGIGGLFAGFSGAPGSFAGGGYTGSGGKYQPAGVVHRGEYVIPADRTRELGVGFLDRLAGFSSGGLVAPTLPQIRSGDVARGAGGMPVVNVSVQTLPGQTADVRQSRGADGAINIAATIRKLVEDEMVNQFQGNGRGAQAVQRRFGLRRSDLA
jgi:tape measure domain-containing protein